MSDVLLAIRGLTKAYPGVVANSDVSFDIRPASVHALLGENGAGKSTLVKTIYGLVRPDAGTMTLAGQPYAPPEPRAARAAGCPVVLVTYGYNHGEPVQEVDADGFLDSLARLDSWTSPVGASRGLG